MKSKGLKRRNFLRNSLVVTTGLFLAPTMISSCKDDEAKNEIPSDYTTDGFKHGVASFDPSASGVIIWTRYENAGTLSWELATDKEFKSVIRSGKVEAEASRDNTVSIELQDLTAGLKLYYRFASKDDKLVSPVGETITLSENPSEVKFAVTSCANYESGYFNVYKSIAESVADVVVHLGDYIYEYASGEYGLNPTTGATGRKFPNKEVITLDDYRERYKLYRTDADLKLAHQKKPFICVWDDHEISNDTWKNGAENHQDDEGAFDARKQAALQAYSEYLPVKTEDINVIYRSIQFGNLINLVLLDTRLIGRDKQLSYSTYINPTTGAFDQASFGQAWLNPARTILGTTQRDWLINEVSKSSATWQILGQQVLMARMLMPAELITTLGQIVGEAEVLGSATPATMMKFQKQLGELAAIKTRFLQGDPTLTAEDKARVTTVLPYNLDAWDGYPAEREMILGALSGKKFVCLAGDTHNAWNSDIKNNSGTLGGYEVATSSVSSPGLETYLGADAQTIAGFEQVIPLLVDDLKYLDASRRGFVLMTVNAGNVKAEYIFVNTISSATYTTVVGNEVTI